MIVFNNHSYHFQLLGRGGDGNYEGGEVEDNEASGRVVGGDLEREACTGGGFP